MRTVDFRVLIVHPVLAFGPIHLVTYQPYSTVTTVVKALGVLFPSSSYCDFIQAVGADGEVRRGAR
jgi:hypothetical protein